LFSKCFNNRTRHILLNRYVFLSENATNIAGLTLGNWTRDLEELAVLVEHCPVRAPRIERRLRAPSSKRLDRSRKRDTILINHGLSNTRQVGKISRQLWIYFWLHEKQHGTELAPVLSVDANRPYLHDLAVFAWS